jgi:hypothetical protein
MMCCKQEATTKAAVIRVETAHLCLFFLQLAKFRAKKKREKELAKTREQRRQQVMEQLQPSLAALGNDGSGSAPIAGADAAASSPVAACSAAGGPFDQDQPVQQQDQTLQRISSRDEAHLLTAKGQQEAPSATLRTCEGSEQLPTDNGWACHVQEQKDTLLQQPQQQPEQEQKDILQPQQQPEQQQEGYGASDSYLAQQQQALRPLQMPLAVQGLQDAAGGASGSATGTPSTAGRSSIAGRGGSMTMGGWQTSAGGGYGEGLGGEDGEEGLVPVAAYAKLQNKYLQAKEKFEEMKRVSGWDGGKGVGE